MKKKSNTIIIYCSYNIIQVFFYTGRFQILFSISLLLTFYLSSWQNFCWNIWDLKYFLCSLNFKIIHIVVFEMFDKMQKIESVWILLIWWCTLSLGFYGKLFPYPFLRHFPLQSHTPYQQAFPFLMAAYIVYNFFSNNTDCWPNHDFW